MGSALKTATTTLVLFMLLSPGLARADAGDAALARDLSKQGYELFLAGQCGDAIPLLVRSQKLAADPRTLVNLARCEDKTGRLGAALDHLVEARDLARDRQVGEMVAQLDALIAEMDRRVARVKVTIDRSAPPDTVVRRGEIDLPRAALERGIAFDPGEQALTVVAPGFEPRIVTVTLREGETRAIVVAPGPRSGSVSPADRTTAPRSSPLRTIGIVSLGIGVPALIAGGIFGALAVGRKSAAEDAGCRDATCPNAEAAGKRDDAKSAGNIATIAFAGGGILTAAGLGIALFVPSTRSAGASARIAPALGGAVLEGRF